MTKSRLMVFENEEFGKVRNLMIDGEPWFIGKDVAEALGYERTTKAIQDHVDNEDKDEIPIQDSIGRMQKTVECKRHPLSTNPVFMPLYLAAGSCLLKSLSIG